MKRNHIVNVRYAFLISCIYLFVFQNLLQTYIPVFQFYDEILAVIAIPIVITQFLKRKTYIINNNIMVLLVIILLLGLSSNIFFKFQTMKYVLFDVFLFFKFYLIYLMSEIVWNNAFVKKYERKLNFHIKFIVLILFIFTLLNYMFIIWRNEMGYNLLSNKLFYSHATFLSGVCIFLLAFSVRLNKKIFTLNNVLIFLILISTLRFKAIGAALAIIFLALYVDKKDKKISISKIAYVGIILLIFAFDQINFYFIKHDGFARKELLTTSFSIANDYFPLGTGFATYGSFYSAENYSPVYYKYNLSNVFGLSPSYHYYVADSFYPMLLGQFGYFGLILYLICIVLLFKKIQLMDIKNNKYEYISKLCAFVYLIISSTSESSFTGPMAISLSLILGFNDYVKEEK